MSADPAQPPTLPEIVARVLGSALFWAPEVRVSKLLPYLEAHGLPLYEALKALPDEDRAALGVDLIRPTGGTAPRPSLSPLPEQPHRLVEVPGVPGEGLLAGRAAARSDVAPPSPRSPKPE